MSILSAAFYFEQVHSVYENVKIAYERLNKCMSQLDRQISDIYHDLERYDIDEAAGYSVAVMLQEALRKRRAVKDELLKLRPIYDLLEHNIGEMDKQYAKANKNSANVRRSLNATLTISDIEKEVAF
ncbi:hypothetical protein GCM10023310_24470 [Paenibacillus vulneris]|uniref:Uncharacterized protein n=1 Tax=Paenibacillus vulneris TaxID=1133364 RepID=A0ABW3UWN2_9BACL